MSFVPDYNPATGERLPLIACGTKEDVNSAARAAAMTAKSFGKYSNTERAELLSRSADLFEEEGDEIAAIETADVGKYISESRMQVLPWTPTPM